MSENVCIIGASHAGVNCAFALRREGWQGEILLFDTEPMLPYHRPPLSKTWLTGEQGTEGNVLKPTEAYEQEGITLCLGTRVIAINRSEKNITLNDGNTVAYGKLVLATGASPIIPSIPGIRSAKNCFSMRTAKDALNIRNTFQKIENKRVVVIGGGYIGLETAASLRKTGGEVTVLEREERVLARVTAPVLSGFFEKLHAEHGVEIFTNKNVEGIETTGNHNMITCSDGSRYEADMIVVGVGIRVNTELAEAAGLEIKNGIRVDAFARTSDPGIYAIGDCTFHHNLHYDRFVRLESVQNAVDQAKIAAAAICGKEVKYDAIPWFWSDQFDVKLQMVGLSQGYNEIVVRNETDRKNSFSVWYFNHDELLAVDAVNNAKAYVLGTRFIKSGENPNKSKLADLSVEFKPANFL